MNWYSSTSLSEDIELNYYTIEEKPAAIVYNFIGENLIE